MALSIDAGNEAQAHKDPVRLPTPELVGRLRDILGARLVAYLGSVRETRAARPWAEGEREPSADVIARLRAAFQIATLLAGQGSPAVVQAWFQGMNPRLADIAPARLLREGDLDESGPAVLAAARAFVSEG